MNAFSSMLNWVRQVAGLIFPFFRQASDFSRWRPWVWRILQIIAFAIFIGGLWALNNYVIPDLLDRLLWDKSPHRFVSKIFLPVLGVLLVALGWILYWIWCHLGVEAEVNEYPDITSAWVDGLARLEARGIKLADLPLYLILGRNKAGEEFLFRAGQVAIDVFGPAAGEPPIRLWAARDAIYLTCPGASALGLYADMLTRAAYDGGGGSQDISKTQGVGDDDNLDAAQVELQAILAYAREQKRALTDEERARQRLLLAQIENAPKVITAKLTADQIATSSSRLRYLCRLLAKERRPFCPLNGILALLSWESFQSDEPAKSTAVALRTDVTTSRGALQLCSPLFALVCDLEESRGFDEFRNGFTDEQLKTRIGQRFPIVPDKPPVEHAALFERGANWIGEQFFPGRVYQVLKLDPNDPRFESARRLFQLFRVTHERIPRLARVLRSGLPTPSAGGDGLEGPLLFAGCYLAGTGREPHEQAFVKGVFDRLNEKQGNVVSWTPSAVANDAHYRYWANVGFAFAIVLIAAIVIECWVLIKGLASS